MLTFQVKKKCILNVENAPFFDDKFITNCFYYVFLINKFTSLPIDSMVSFCDYFHAKDIYPNLRN